MIIRRGARAGSATTGPDNPAPIPARAVVEDRAGAEDMVLVEGLGESEAVTVRPTACTFRVGRWRELLFESWVDFVLGALGEAVLDARAVRPECRSSDFVTVDPELPLDLRVLEAALDRPFEG